MQGSGYQTSRNTLRKFKLRIFSIAVAGEPPANGPGIPALRDCVICRTQRLPSGQLLCTPSGVRPQDLTCCSAHNISSDGRLVIRIRDRDLFFEVARRSGRRPPRTPGGTRCAALGPPQQPSAGRAPRMRGVSSTPNTPVKRKGLEELRGGRASNRPPADGATDRAGPWRGDYMATFGGKSPASPIPSAVIPRENGPPVVGRSWTPPFGPSVPS